MQFRVPGTIVQLYMTAQIAQIVQIFTNCAILGQIARLCIITIFCSLAVILIVCKMKNVASSVKMLAIINSIDINAGDSSTNYILLASRVGFIQYQTCFNELQLPKLNNVWTSQQLHYKASSRYSSEVH